MPLVVNDRAACRASLLRSLRADVTRFDFILNGGARPMSFTIDVHHHILPDEFWRASGQSATAAACWCCSARLAHVAALMKTRYENWPSETDAEIRVFVLGFAIRRQGRTQQRPRVGDWKDR
jgi:hypothetical protein